MKWFDLDDKPVGSVQSGYFKIGRTLQIENDTCGSRSGFSDAHALNQLVPDDLVDRGAAVSDQRARVKDVDVKAVGVNRTVGTVSEWTGGVDNDARGIGPGPRADACNLN